VLRPRGSVPAERATSAGPRGGETWRCVSTHPSDGIHTLCKVSPPPPTCLRLLSSTSGHGEGRREGDGRVQRDGRLSLAETGPASSRGLLPPRQRRQGQDKLDRRASRRECSPRQPGPAEGRHGVRPRRRPQPDPGWRCALCGLAITEAELGCVAAPGMGQKESLQIRCSFASSIREPLRTARAASSLL
jgi:hypothetical protein